jgi:tetratricopeptide (TPR) repeat protein
MPSNMHHHPPNRQALSQRIDLLLSLHRPAEAEKTARELIAAFPEQGEGYSHLARCLIVQARTKDALDAAKEGRSKNPHDAWTHYVLAYIQLSAKRYREAETSALAALQINPYHSDARQTLAQSYLNRAQFRKAERTIKDGLENDPLHHDLRLAQVRLSYDRGRFAEAVNLAKEALTHHPDSHQFHCYLGISKWSMARRINIRAALRDHREAGVHLTEACRLNPSESDYVENVIQNAVAARKQVYGLFVLIFISIHLVPIICPLLAILLFITVIREFTGKRKDIPALPDGFILSAPFPKHWFPITPPDPYERIWIWVWRGLIALASIELICLIGFLIAYWAGLWELP